MLDAPSSELLGLSFRTRFAPELGRRVAGLIVVLCPHQTIAPGDRSAVRAPDLLPDLPLGRERFGCEDEPVDPEEDETADEVGDDGRGERPKPAEQREHSGEDGRRELPPDEVEDVAFGVYIHVRIIPKSYKFDGNARRGTMPGHEVGPAGHRSSLYGHPSTRIRRVRLLCTRCS